MSDRLAISATFSVLMMSLYVLFGTDAARVPFAPAEMSRPAAVSVSAALTGPSRLNVPHLPRMID